MKTRTVKPKTGERVGAVQRKARSATSPVLSPFATQQNSSGLFSRYQTVDVLQRSSLFSNSLALQTRDLLIHTPIQRAPEPEEREEKENAFSGQAKLLSPVQRDIDESDESTQEKSLVQREADETEEEAQEKSLIQRESEEEESGVSAQEKSLVQREGNDTEESVQEKPLIQRAGENEAEERDKKDNAFSGQARLLSPVQRDSDESEEATQEKSLVQLESAEGEPEEGIQEKTLVQRDVDDTDEAAQEKSLIQRESEEDESGESTQEKPLVQREADVSEEDMQAKPALQFQEKSETEEEDVQSKSLIQRQDESDESGSEEQEDEPEHDEDVEEGEQEAAESGDITETDDIAESEPMSEEEEQEREAAEEEEAREAEEEAREEEQMAAEEEQDKAEELSEEDAPGAESAIEQPAASDAEELQTMSEGPIQFGFFSRMRKRVRKRFRKLASRFKKKKPIKQSPDNAGKAELNKAKAQEKKAEKELEKAGGEALKDPKVVKSFKGFSTPFNRKKALALVAAKTKAKKNKLKKEEALEALTQEKLEGTAATGRTVGSQIRSSRGGGSPLPGNVRGEMEDKFGEDFSNVRIHTGENSAGLNKSLKAKAFTNREDIHFNRGQFDPEGASGKHLLAHELTHVVQQRSIPDLQRRLKSGGERDFYEHEADSMADKVTAGNAAPAKQDITPLKTPTAGLVPTTQLTQKQTTSASPITGDAVQFGFWKRARRRLRRLGRRIKKAVKRIGKAMKKAIRAVGKRLKKLGRMVVKAVKAGVKFAVKGIKFLKGLLKKALLWLLKRMGNTGKNIAKLIEMSGKALKYILKNPKGFFKNLGKGLFQGFKNFFKNIKTHLKNGLKGFLEMKLGGRINFPKKFNLRGIFSLILQILGLSFEVIKNVFAKVLGRINLEAILMFVKGDWKGGIKNLLRSRKLQGKESQAYAGGKAKSKEAEETEAAAAVTDDTIALVKEKSGGIIKLFKDIKEKGPIAIWRFIKKYLGKLKAMLLKTIMEVVIKKMIVKAIEILATSSNPVGAIIRLVITVWNILKFFFRNFNRLINLIIGIVASFIDMALNSPQKAAQKVENTLARFIPLAIDFVLSLIGLSGIVDHIIRGIKKLRDLILKPVRKVAKVIAKIVKPVFNVVRNAVVKAKAFVGKGIMAAKARGKAVVDKARAKGRALLEKGKEEAVGLFKKRWSSLDAALRNRHESEIGKDLSPDEKRRQWKAVRRVNKTLKKFRKRESSLEEINAAMSKLQSEQGFSVLKGKNESGRLVLEFGFSQPSESEEKSVKLSWGQKVALWIIDKSGSTGQKIAELIRKSGKATPLILESRESVTKFVINLSKALGNSVGRFKENFFPNLKEGFLNWLSGASKFIMPKAFDLKGVFSVIVQIAGMGKEQIKHTLGTVFEKRNVEAVDSFAQGDWEGGVQHLLPNNAKVTPSAIGYIKKTGGILLEVFQAIKKQGLGGLWQYIQGRVGDIKEMLIGKLKEVIFTEALKAVAKHIVALTNPAGAIGKLIATLWNFMMFIVNNIERFLDVLNGIISSFLDIVAGKIGAATDIIYNVFKKFIPIIIDLFIRVSGLSGIANKIFRVMKDLQKKIKEAIIKFATPIAGKVKKTFNTIRTHLGRILKGKGKSVSRPAKPYPGESEHDAKVRVGLADLDKEGEKIDKDKDNALYLEEAKQVAKRVKTKHPVFRSITVIDGGTTWDYKYVASEKKIEKGNEKESQTEQVEATKRLPIDKISKGMEIDPTKTQVFRGGRDLTLKAAEFKIDKVSGLVKPTHGASLDVVAGNVQRFGGAHQIKSIPSQLKIIQRGGRMSHFEIMPRQQMSVEQFQSLLNQVKFY